MVTDNLVSSLIWSIIECSLGIICVAIPPMRPLLSRMFPKLLRSQTYTTGARGNSYAMTPRKASAAAGGATIGSQKMRGSALVNSMDRDHDPVLDGHTLTEIEEGRAVSEVASSDVSTEELTEKSRRLASGDP
jgi:hypothetical protein